MDLVYSPYALASFVAGGLTAFVLAKLRRRGEVPGTGTFVVVLLSGTVWSLTEGVILSTWDPSLRLLAAKVQYLAVALGPLHWFLFTLRYTGVARFLLRPFNVALLAVIPAAVLGGAWTNEYHHALWKRLDVLRTGPYPLTDVEYGWLFRVHQSFTYLAFSVSTLILLGALFRAPKERRGPLANAVSLPFFPVVLNLLYLMGNRTNVHVDLTPIGFALASACVGVGLFRQQLFNIVPLARDTVLDALPDPVFVIDDHGHLLDANPAARELIAKEPSVLAQVSNKGDKPEVEFAGRFFEHSRRNVSGIATRAEAIRLHDVTERRTIEMELREAQERLRRSHLDLEKLASTDALTGLPNRRAFFEALRNETLRSERSGRPFALVITDLDRFKQINDRFGHQTGDFALESVAADLRRAMRENDVAARVGGEEFALILPDTDLPGALTLAERVRAAVARTISSAGAEFQVSMSLGVVLHQKGMSEKELISRADAALYQAKHEGRNRVVPASRS